MSYLHKTKYKYLISTAINVYIFGLSQKVQYKLLAF
jgi:hypothetical protein